MPFRVFPTAFGRDRMKVELAQREHEYASASRGQPNVILRSRCPRIFGRRFRREIASVISTWFLQHKRAGKGWAIPRGRSSAGAICTIQRLPNGSSRYKPRPLGPERGNRNQPKGCSWMSGIGQLASIGVESRIGHEHTARRSSRRLYRALRLRGIPQNVASGFFHRSAKPRS
jgi:hypothetical protein